MNLGTGHTWEQMFHQTAISRWAYRYHIYFRLADKAAENFLFPVYFEQ